VKWIMVNTKNDLLDKLILVYLWISKSFTLKIDFRGLGEIIPPVQMMKSKIGCSRSISGLFQEILVQIQLELDSKKTHSK